MSEYIKHFQNPPENFSSNRIKFRKPFVSDAKAVFTAYAGDIEAVKYMSWPVKKTVEEAEDFLRRVIIDWESSSAFTWLCLDEETDKVIGCAAFRPSRTGYEIGYVLSPEVWGKGLGTELVQKMIEIAFLDNKVQRVWAYCDIENIPSQKVLLKAGMEKEGLLRNWGISPNLGKEARDQFCFSALP